MRLSSKLIFRSVLLFAVFLFIKIDAMGQDKTCNYSFGEPGTAKFENLVFRVSDGNKLEVEYFYGKEWKESTLKYLGQVQKEGRKCVKVQFKNGYELFISIDKLHLRVEDASGKYLKIFDWFYEGPVEGIGTFCESCAEDEKQSMKWMQHYFFN